MQSTAEGAENSQSLKHQAPPVTPPQWLPAMPYPGGAMVMPHQMMGVGGPPLPPQFAPHYLPYHHVAAPVQPKYQQQQQQQQAQGSTENRTIWVGDLQFWMDENYLQHCFGLTGEVVLVKVIRNKQTGLSEGYGFVEFQSHAAAEKVIQTFNGLIMPNTEQLFRINWATFSSSDRRSEVSSDHSIFVGDLASDVTDTLLQETFDGRYSSVKGAKVVIDVNTGRSKGYGFVRFGDESEKLRAMTEMNGVFCSSRAMRIGAATPRKSSGFSSNGSQASNAESDLSNTTVFVGGLDPTASEEDLRQAFSQYGDISSIKIPVGKQCGFVQFVYRNNAEEAMQGLNGTVIGKQTVRLSWGRNGANKQSRGDSGGQWSNAAYYGGQLFDGYGYAVPPQSPGIYAAPAAYGAYPVFGNQQQVS
ncbi:polyadenylate-binding protein RBP47-like [Wolffia australiana]